MVNLQTSLNKFHNDKREFYSIDSSNNLWQKAQSQASNLLDQGEDILFSAKKQLWNQAKIAQGPGVYMVNDQTGDLIYLGESTDVKHRHHMHSNRTYISALRRHIGTDLLDLDFVKTKRILKGRREKG